MVHLHKPMPNVTNKLVVQVSILTFMEMHSSITVSVQDLGLILLLIGMKYIIQIQFSNTLIKFALKTPQHSLVLQKINVSKSALIQ